MFELVIGILLNMPDKARESPKTVEPTICIHVNEPSKATHVKEPAQAHMLKPSIAISTWKHV